MDSTARFLLGGALGAALGYLLSQKNLEKALQTGQLPPTETTTTGTPATRVGHRAAEAPAPAAMAPAAAAPAVSAPERPSGSVSTLGTPLIDRRPAPAPEWRIPPAPPAEWRPAPAPEPAAPVAATPEMRPAPASAPLVTEFPAVAETSESEVVLTRDFLEEPIPGSGWAPSATLAVEEATLDDTSRVVPEVIVSRVGPELGRPPVESRESVASESTEQMVEESIAELPVVEELAELPVIEESVELREVEDSVTDAVAEGRTEVEALAEAATVADQLPAVESKPSADSARVDDLKSRIEETRRRIRHELEQPFDTSEAVGPPERDWTVAPVVPVIEDVAVRETVIEEAAVEEPVWEEPVIEEALVEEAPIEETVVEEPVALEPLAMEPVAAEPVAVEPVAVEAVAVEAVAVAPAVEEPVVEKPRLVEPLELIVESGEVDTDVELGLEEPVDYDSMKDRIETTRSRLKAKAFDAMMTGESALLGRDVEGSDRGQQSVPGVDSEVDETIETSLREEEE